MNVVPSSEIWAITTYFNPARFLRRQLNFREFRKRLGIPLLAVELSFGGPFDLREDDAELLVRRTDGDVMWQKERLLNIALAELPPSCRFVAWLDCDLIFAHSDWPDMAVRALHHHPLVQLFSDLYLMPSGISASAVNAAEAEARLPSLGSAVRSGLSARECFDQMRQGSAHAYSASPAWAMARKTLTDFGFYDACIVGGGDSAFICGALGFPDVVTARHAMNKRRAEHYRRWAEVAGLHVGGEFGVLNGPAFHLWHGDIKDRRYAERHQKFQQFDFDPERDIAAGQRDAWRWNSDKPRMHRYVASYFASRHEDGVEAPG